MYEHLNVHVLMRDERRKEERSKQGQTNNNPGAKVRVITREARYSTPLFRELTRRARLREEA